MRQDERLLTPKELALAWRQSPGTIRRKIAAGEIPAVRLGTGPRPPIRIPVDELERWLHKPRKENRHA